MKNQPIDRDFIKGLPLSLPHDVFEDLLQTQQELQRYTDKIHLIRSCEGIIQALSHLNDALTPISHNYDIPNLKFHIDKDHFNDDIYFYFLKIKLHHPALSECQSIIESHLQHINHIGHMESFNSFENSINVTLIELIHGFNPEVALLYEQDLLRNSITQNYFEPKTKPRF